MPCRTNEIRFALTVLGDVVRGAVYGLSVWAIDMLFVPFDRVRWLENLSPLQNAMPELLVFSIAMLAVIAGAQSAGRGDTLLRAAGSLAATSLAQCATFVILFVHGFARKQLPLADAIAIEAGLIFWLSATAWLSSHATYLIVRTLRSALRRRSMSRAIVFVVLAQALFSGRVQPVQDMLSPLRWVSEITPLRWQLEGQTIALDWFLGYAVAGRQCAIDATKCFAQEVGTFSGGTCLHASAIGLRRNISSAITLTESADNDLRALWAASQIAPINGNPHDLNELDAFLSKITADESYCPDGEPFLLLQALPSFSFAAKRAPPVENAWNELVILDPELALYRGCRTIVWGWLAILWIVPLIGAVAIERCRYRVVQPSFRGTIRTKKRKLQ